MVLALVLISVALSFVSGFTVAVLWLRGRSELNSEPLEAIKTAATGRIDSLLGRKQIKVFKKKESQPFEKDVLDKLDAEVNASSGKT